MKLRWWRRKREEELHEEIAAHIRMAVSDRMERGETREQAEAAARLEFGNSLLVRDVTSDMWGWTWLEQLLQDVRYGLRTLLRSPGYTLVVVLTLALGIGANTAIFSAVNAVLLRPLPSYEDPDRLVTLRESLPQAGLPRFPVRPAVFADWQARARSFQEMAGSRDAIYTLTGLGEPLHLTSYRFSENFFRVLGKYPMLGRGFTPEEDNPGGARVAIISHKLWQSRLGGDPAAVGRSITLNGDAYTIIGVMPPGFDHPGGSQLWTPLALPPDAAANRQQQRSFLRIVARLKPGVTVADARAEMAAINRQLQQEHPATDAGRGVTLDTIREQYSGDIRPALLALMGGVGFVLLVACANVANLALARATVRQKEAAIRLALGAGRWRALRQTLTETMLLSSIGGLLGLLLAFWGGRFLLSMFPQDIANLAIPKIETLEPDARVYAFALAVSLLTGLLCGLIPAIHASRSSVSEAMKGAGRATHGTGATTQRGALVVSEVALALVLLIGAGLVIRSFLRLQQADLGFTPDRVVTSQAFLPQYKYREPKQMSAFVQNVVRRLEALPGVETAAAISFLPLSGFSSGTSFQLEGAPAPRRGDEPVAGYHLATPNYLRSMSIRLLRGRDFTDRDREGSPQVILVNETLARRHFAGQDPVGKRLNLGTPAEPVWCEIVGVTGDVKSAGLHEETRADIYRPFAQAPFPYVSFTVRGAAGTAGLADAVKREIWAVDKDQAIAKSGRMDDLAAQSLALRRVSTLLFASFGALALVLASIGIYGVMSYAVAQRRNELAIRQVLGAARLDVLKLVIGQGMKLALVGVALGLAAAFALTRLLSTLLYEVKPADALTFTGVSLAAVVVSAIACYLPARSALAVDPLVSLRWE